MILKNKRNMTNQNVNNLAAKMVIALVAGLITGILLLFIREGLNSYGYEHIWSLINNIFFQDISASEGKNAIGIFYIIGQLFINCLQLIIVPMIFSSIVLAMCQISDTKKLGRISGKTLLGFFTTSVFALIVAVICGFIAYKLGEIGRAHV